MEQPDPLFDKLLSLMTVEELKDGIRQFSAQWNACQDLLASMTRERDLLQSRLDAALAEGERLRGYIHVSRVDIRNVCVRLSMDEATDNKRDHLELCRIGKFLDEALSPPSG